MIMILTMAITASTASPGWELDAPLGGGLDVDVVAEIPGEVTVGVSGDDVVVGACVASSGIGCATT